ncbi:Hypothetical protein D9617_21g097150 [Elsinoe fawcettii]|nr:Hypothetical protein D9617_21g097150 [Elsinoe fawcettii]
MSMPVTNLPPTPAASLDITGKTSSSHTPSISLGPAAVADGVSDRSVSATPSVNGSESSYHPASPVSPNMSKRKQPQPPPKTKTADGFNLPPPPSRSRKIIQMKPRHESTNDQQEPAPAAAEPATTTKGGRKRANNGTTAAGRKIARKTAHSLIERRRRSKMNEEFGVLKDMIPACQGQEMHKLAILQASIDYLRYLETCITELKSNQTSTAAPPAIRHPDAMDEDEPSPSATSPASSFPPSAQTTRPPTSQSVRTSYSPAQQLPPLSHITTASTVSSPAFTPIDPTPRVRQFSLSTNSSANFSPYMLPQSTSTSPVFSPQHKSSLSNIAGDAMQRFSLTSPALDPHDVRHDMRPVSQLGTTAPVKAERSDREAMAALLMLNSDRRSTVSGWRDGVGAVDVEEVARRQSKERKKGSAMSVRDLLSS